MALILDTGPLYAAVNRNDRDHRACRRLIETSTEDLIIPSPVLGEMDYWLDRRRFPNAMADLLADVERGAYLVEDVHLSDYARIRTLCLQYADSDIGFVDAAVLATVERLNEPKLATLDHRHFRMLRPRHVDALQLLPEL